MPKSDLDARFAQGDALLQQIRDGQLERLKRVGDLWEEQLKDWNDLAKAEESVRREYRGRYLFELLQNANDAIVDAYLASDKRALDSGLNKVRLELTPASLLIANCGLPFAENNIRALCRLHQTTKSASKQIGHKGIGFKSVLEVTDAPEVYSDRYAFGFDRKEFTAKARQVVGSNNLTESQLPILRAPFARRLSRLNPAERERIEHLLIDDEFATVIRLPFKTDKLHVDVEERLRAEIGPQLLLFLEFIQLLEVCYPSGEEVAYWRDDPEKAAGLKASTHKDILLWSDKGGKAHVVSHWLVLNPKELRVTNRSLVKDLGEAWEEVQSVKCTVAFPLTADGKFLQTDLPHQAFQVYFPTQESSGVRFLVNADFYIEAARKDIRRNPLNDWLIQELAFHVASTGVDVLRARFPSSPSIVDMLAPAQQPDRELGGYFFDQYVSALGGSEFVPISGGQYKTPADIRFPPIGADPKGFREFFPAGRLRGQANWAFPLLDVEVQELERNTAGHPFLLKQELGTRQLDVGDIVAALQNGPIYPNVNRGEFLRFLAHWWDASPLAEKGKLEQALAECRIIPTTDGWQIPTRNIFQANLREGKELSLPKGFGIVLVPLEVYGDERSYDGVPANFLKALGVDSYEARSLLRVIFPKLTSPDEIQALTEHSPESIFAAYTFLKQYYENERRFGEFKDELSRVQVPAFRAKDPNGRVWKSAGEVYFSSYWTASEDLEAIYGQFEDVYFLGPTSEWDELEEQEQKQSWYGFWAWLGVNHKPRLIAASLDYAWGQARSIHPFRDRAFWLQYLDRYRDKFVCPTLGKGHGQSRRIGQTWALQHFEELASAGDINLLARLFGLLGLYWENYRPFLKTELRCERAPRGCQTESIPSYLAYCLSEVEWLPGLRWGKLAAQPFRGSDIWLLGEDVGSEVRQMLPSLPDEFSSEKYRSIRLDLLKTEVEFRDYLGMLQRLPDLCPLAPADLSEDALKAWQDAVRAVFNWLGEALNNSLIRKGDENRPELPSNLRVFAYEDSIPAYIEVGSPILVYPDDPFLAREWSNELYYLKIDKSWNSLREWLGVPRLTEKVSTTIDILIELPEESDAIRRQYREALPYFMALVFEQQNSRFTRVLGRLRRLDLHAVDQLTLVQQFMDADPAMPAKRFSESAYLRPRDEPNPRGGGTARAGDLFVSRSEVNNPDILGAHIANYIEIDRLDDAFVVLYGRQDHFARMRYLHSRGVSDDLVAKAVSELQKDSDGGSVSTDYDDLIQSLLKKELLPGGLPEPKQEPIDPPAPPNPPAEKPAEPVTPPISEAEELPPLDLTGAINVETYSPSVNSASPQDDNKGRKPKGGGGGNGYSPISEEKRLLLGKRGEEWAYSCERQRLVALGLNPDTLEREGQLEWVARRDKFANHDIRSVEVSNGLRKTIYIEVKSTTKQDRSIVWTRSEYKLAREKRSDYWLYWVAKVDSARPNLPLRFQDPIELLHQGRLQVDFRQLDLRLPDETE